MRKPNGFSIIELLTVFIIMGLIIGFVLVSGSSSRARARDDQRVNDMKIIQQALELYRLEVDRSGDDTLYAYPLRYLSGNDLAKSGIYPEATDLFKKYLATTPIDPHYKKQYHYYAPGCVRPGAGSPDSPAIVSPGKVAKFHTLTDVQSKLPCPDDSGWVPYVLYVLLERPVTGSSRESALSNVAEGSDRALIYTPSQPLFPNTPARPYQIIDKFSYCYPSSSRCLDGYSN